MNTAADESHRLQAASLWRRWRSRPRRPAGAEVRQIPAHAGLPAEAWRHYRHFSWVVYEQRIVLLVLGFFLAGSLWVWRLATHLEARPPLFVRAGPSLREAAAAFYGRPEASYDALALFLQGSVPLLFSTSEAGHPLLPLAEGLVAPEIYRRAQERLDGTAPQVRKNRMTQSLTLTEIDDVADDAASGRAAARLRGFLAVTFDGSGARIFPWAADAVLAANTPGRLDPYPYYLLRLDERPAR